MATYGELELDGSFAHKGISLLNIIPDGIESIKK